MRKTGVCCAFEPVSAVMCTVEISGHRKVVFVFVSTSSDCQGRKVRWMPSVRSHGCAEVLPERETANW
ncbi:hypothetical protein M2157_004829 [Streptomyces sp. SAI-127]|nr:hypothetical protein [Streptomyces sp. SAI-127]